MNSRRKIILITALAALVLAVAPSTAPASSLLSGYGGPGQGTQAILGSGLVGGSSGGGGGSAGGSSAAPASSAGATATGATGSGPVGHSFAHHANRAAQPSTGSSSAAGSGLLAHVPASPVSAGGSGVLGLSYVALLIGLLALSAVLFAGLLVRGLARTGGTRSHVGN
jgi:hypothetical protein